MADTRLYRWEAYYRYRRNYEHGGPWVYVRNMVTTVLATRDELEPALRRKLWEGTEIISLRRKHELYSGLSLGEGSVVKAGEAIAVAARGF